eukprot:TRINITY_DN1122_c0_g1_i1.p1 TRINITY_DN1122_c0_g1~~TRINITY_DN1122_c0_g1_i1.p1  ORF type:complete len:225 (-),score=45.43 TRINITY_DN1122_c0_g1_i1:63-737(-)
MPLTLYAHPVSQPSRAVMWLLMANKIPFDFKLIDFMKGETRTPDFKAINPNGSVPVIDDDGFALYESNAILAYISNKHNLTSWYPTDPKVRGKIDQYLHWHHGNSRLTTTQFFRPVLMAAMAGGAPAKEDLEKGAAVVKKFLAVAETEYFKTEGGFMFGAEPTIADLAFYCELDQLEVLKLFDFSEFANVSAWMKKMQTVPAFAESHKGLHDFAAFVASKKAAK